MRRALLRLAAGAVAAMVLAPVCARLYVHRFGRDRVFWDPSRVPHCRVALVLGAGVRPDGRLSVQLQDRVDAAIKLYRAGAVEKLLMSGDNRVTHYNEPQRMGDYAIRRTYDSIYRAKHVFGLNRIIVVSQRFHLDRALFLCDHIGVRATGFAADVKGHRSIKIEIRELGACLAALVDVSLRRPRPVMGKRERI
ncbi:MAG: SanA/YdcF family protein [Armatimonadota bacterium]